MAHPEPLPLRNLRVASPCKARWADMTGDDRVRHCGSCDRQVFDLSQMTRAEATELLATRGVKPCVRFYRRADGTVMTADCPTTARRSPRLAVVAAGTAMLAASPALAEPPSIDEPANASDADAPVTPEQIVEPPMLMGEPMEDFYDEPHRPAIE